VTGDRHGWRKYLREDAMPLFWCAGCGNGVILGALLRVFAKLDLDPRRMVAVTGIGCFGKADDYIKTNAVHATHGRALAVATGVKLANPGLTVVALMGDGDCATIGGNHLIHAARRNVGVLAVVANNLNYGMTGGQFSATTPEGGISSTSPYGNPEAAFDLCALAEAAGAPFVARTTVYHVAQVQNLLEAALRRPVFSLVEVLSSCPVHFGRHNNRPRPKDMMDLWRDVALPVARFREMDPPQRAGRYPIGVLVDRERPDFCARYAEVRERARAGGAGTRPAPAER
jgi:2-oxoglutarate ferredoxin oxidoreductase subunit beta